MDGDYPQMPGLSINAVHKSAAPAVHHVPKNTISDCGITLGDLYPMPMSIAPPSLSEKVAQATALWLFASFISIPLWDMAYVLFAAYLDGSFLRALAGFLPSPGGTVLGLVIMFGIHAEHGIGAIAERYWPAGLMASAITILFMGWYWRRW